MLADSVVSLGWLVMRPTISFTRAYGPRALESIQNGTLREDLRNFTNPKTRGYSPVNLEEPITDDQQSNGILKTKSRTDAPEPDAPPEHLIGTKTTLIGLVLSLGVCVGAVHYAFSNLIPLPLTLLALLLGESYNTPQRFT